MYPRRALSRRRQESWSPPGLSLTKFVSLVFTCLLQGNENNARPVQDLNDRDISLFRPKLHKQELLSFKDKLVGA
jgi:hypothetical protein